MIYHTNNEFPFNNLYLSTPVELNKDMHFSKIKINNDNDVLVQFPKCFCNRIVNKYNKKFVDLTFDIHNEKLIKWIASINKVIKYLIFQKNNEWYDTFISLEIINDNYMNFSKKYNDKNIVIKILINDDELKKITCYDENGSTKQFNDISCNTPITPLLELVGIKITEKNFLVILKFNQIMVMEEKNIKINNKIQINNKEDVDSYSSSYESSDDNEYESNEDNDDTDTDEDDDEGFNINDILEESDDNVLNLEMLNNLSESEYSTDEEDLELFEDDLENKETTQKTQTKDLENKETTQKTQTEDLENKETTQEIQTEDLENKETTQEIQTEDLENKEITQEIQTEDLENKEITQEIQTEDLENKEITQEIQTEDLENKENNENNDKDIKNKNLKMNNTLEKDKLVNLENVKPKTLENTKYLEEVNISNIIYKNNDDIRIKAPKNIYYDLYFKAKKIAEEKKKESIRAFFELNQIKDILIEKKY